MSKEQKSMDYNNQTNKPDANIYGADGNVFNLIAICSIALKNAGKKKSADEMQKRILNCGSYDEALSIMGEYCNLC